MLKPGRKLKMKRTILDELEDLFTELRQLEDAFFAWLSSKFIGQ
jgi:hypothetical protein